ncbi:MAG: alpha-ketoglutarate-dependent dioxygenase AlkB [Bacteriovoracaceae bacterium]
MNIVIPRKDFVIIEDFFRPEEASAWVESILKKGDDPVRGFHHPDLRPNRFHQQPKYPVKKYMCFGFYWNPLDYAYYPKLPGTEVSPFPILSDLKLLVQQVLLDHYQWTRFSPESVLVNYYTDDSSMGIHVDKDEEDQISPVVGLSFGSACRFLYEDEAGDIKDYRLPGNSLYIFGRSARRMRHGVGTLYSQSLAPGSEGYLKNKERMSLTIRQIFNGPI